MEDVKLVLFFQKGKGDPKNSKKSYFELLRVINFDTFTYKNYCILPEKQNCGRLNKLWQGIANEKARTILNFVLPFSF